MHDIRLQELRLYTDAGRCCRPLFIVEDQQLLIKKGDIHKLNNRDAEEEGFTWRDLVFSGYIECAPPWPPCAALPRSPPTRAPQPGVNAVAPQQGVTPEMTQSRMMGHAFEVTK